MAHRQVAKLKEKHDIALQGNILATTMEGRGAGDKDILDFILTRPADYLWLTAHTVSTVMTRTVMANGQNIGAHLWQLQANGAVIGIAQNRHARFSNPKTRKSVPSNIHA